MAFADNRCRKCSEGPRELPDGSKTLVSIHRQTHHQAFQPTQHTTCGEASHSWHRRCRRSPLPGETSSRFRHVHDQRSRDRKLRDEGRSRANLKPRRSSAWLSNRVRCFYSAAASKPVLPNPESAGLAQPNFSVSTSRNATLAGFTRANRACKRSEFRLPRPLARKGLVFRSWL